MRTVTIDIGNPTYGYGYGVKLQVSEDNLPIVLEAIIAGRANGVTEIKISEPLMVLLEDGTYAPSPL